jgi:hypothetical protein
MKKIVSILSIFFFLLSAISAQESIVLQNVELENSRNTIDAIRLQQQLQQEIIESMFENLSFEYVHILPTGFPREDIPKNIDHINFNTWIDIQNRVMYVFIRRFIDGWYCEYVLVFTNSNKLDGMENRHYSCKLAEDIKMFWSQYKEDIKRFVGIDFDRNNNPILIKPPTYGGMFG